MFCPLFECHLMGNDGVSLVSLVSLVPSWFQTPFIKSLFFGQLFWGTLFQALNAFINCFMNEETNDLKNNDLLLFLVQK